MSEYEFYKKLSYIYNRKGSRIRDVRDRIYDTISQYSELFTPEIRRQYERDSIELIHQANAFLITPEIIQALDAVITDWRTDISNSKHNTNTSEALCAQLQKHLLVLSSHDVIGDLMDSVRILRGCPGFKKLNPFADVSARPLHDDLDFLFCHREKMILNSSEREKFYIVTDYFITYATCDDHSAEDEAHLAEIVQYISERVKWDYLWNNPTQL